jgi:hypothetical protein
MFTIFIYSSTYRYKIWEIKIFTIEDLDDYLIFNNVIILISVVLCKTINSGENVSIRSRKVHQNITKI